MTSIADQPRWLTEEEMTLWRLILDANRKLDRAMEISFQGNDGISSSEFAVLVALDEAPDHRLRLRELCDELEWDRSRTSHQITRMVKRGFVGKVRCAGDARGVFVEMTEEGRALLDNAAPNHLLLVRDIVFGDLDYSDIPQITKFLRMLCASADKWEEQEEAED